MDDMYYYHELFGEHQQFQIKPSELLMQSDAEGFVVSTPEHFPLDIPCQEKSFVVVIHLHHTSRSVSLLKPHYRLWFEAIHQCSWFEDMMVLDFYM